jgi:PHD/YefM family antitoxin component YafN of YafNO toxin-antitoxin module
MDMTEDTQPLTAFRDRPADAVRHLKTTGRPVTLTVDGLAVAVLQDPEAYQRLLDLAAEASAAEGIRQGLEDLQTGRARPAHAVLDEIRAERGIPR